MDEEEERERERREKRGEGGEKGDYPITLLRHAQLPYDISWKKQIDENNERVAENLVFSYQNDIIIFSTYLTQQFSIFTAIPYARQSAIVPKNKILENLKL